MTRERIACGWCSRPTTRGACVHCGHDAEIPWVQRGGKAPVIAEGRKALSEREITTRYEAAKATLKQDGKSPTIENIAEVLDRSPRTVREWRERFGLS